MKIGVKNLTLCIRLLCFQRVSNADGVYEKDKVRLANMMAFGQDVTPASETRKPVRRPQKPEVESDEEEVDRFQECKHCFCKDKYTYAISQPSVIPATNLH